MPYHLTWLAEPRILYAEATGVFAMSEIKHANQTLMRLLNETKMPLYLICDVSALIEYPRIASELREAVPYFYHPMFACEYFYGVRSPAMGVIVRFLRGFSPFVDLIVDSLDDALAAIVTREPGLRAIIGRLDLTLASRQPIAPV